MTDDNKRTIQRVQTKYNSCHLLHFIEAIYGLSHVSGGKSARSIIYSPKLKLGKSVLGSYEVCGGKSGSFSGNNSVAKSSISASFRFFGAPSLDL